MGHVGGCPGAWRAHFYHEKMRDHFLSTRQKLTKNVYISTPIQPEDASTVLASFLRHFHSVLISEFFHSHFCDLHSNRTD